MSTEPLQLQLRALALLTQLQRQARAAEDPAALGFVIVNETHGLVNYRQAALWTARPDARVVAVSGTATLDQQAPFIVWVWALCRHQFDHGNPPRATALTAADCPPDLSREWRHWLPRHAVWQPLSAHGKPVGGLLLARDEAWREAETVLLGEIADAYGHAWQSLQPKTPEWRRLVGGAPIKYGLPALALAFLLPVRQSVLAPAEVVAAEPVVIRAPLEGVVDAFLIQPNQKVDSRQTLLTLENTDIANRLEISRKALAVAEAEYRKTAQQAMFDPKSKAELAVLKARMDQHEAEVAYMREQLARSTVKAPREGVAIFSNVHDWIGRPVALGEKVLLLADPRKVELEVRLPVADLIELADNAEAKVFLNIDPQHSLTANVYSLSYQAEIGADNILAYRLKARLSGAGPMPRIGLKGTAKVYGRRVSLFYYLFRRPLSGLRQWLGW